VDEMLTKNTQMNRDQIEMIALEQLVPANHLVRKIEAAIDFSFIYSLVQDMYSSERGRPSIDPVVLIKMAFIQYTFGIRSMRQTISEIETNVAYRWFLGFGFYDKVPHFSTFGKNYERRFKDTDLFEQIFYRILKEASDKNAASDRNGFVLGAIVTPGNIHDSVIFEPLLEKVIDKHGKPEAVAADAGYKTPPIAQFVFENDMTPALPYTRPRTKDGYMKKHEYIYDEYYDCYICPQGQILKYTTTTKNGKRQYFSNPLECQNCPLLSECTQSKEHKKLIERPVWEHYIEEADHLRHTQENKSIYARRKETIERVFADAKEKHGMRWTTLRGLKKLSMQAMLTFAAMNLKKMANWTWKGPEMV
jgi:transposase